MLWNASFSYSNFLLLRWFFDPNREGLNSNMEICWSSWPSLFASSWMSSSRNFRRTWSSLRSLNGTQKVGLRQFSSRLRWSRLSLSIVATNVHPPPATQWNSAVPLLRAHRWTVKCTELICAPRFLRVHVSQRAYNSQVRAVRGNSHTVIVHVAVNLNFSASQQYRVGATIGVWIFILDVCTRVRLKMKFECKTKERSETGRWRVGRHK